MVRSKLSPYEIYGYFLIWTFGIFYSLYNVYLAGDLFDHSYSGDDFSNSWFGRKKDITDYEWANFIPFILYSLSPWILIHLAVTEFVRWTLVEAVPVCYLLITSLFILSRFGLIVEIYFFCQVIFYFFILRLSSRILIWIFGIPLLLVSSFVIQEISDRYKISNESYLLMVVSNGWMHLRCSSFCFDFIKNSKQKANWKDLITMLGYCFYLPVFFIGPIILYEDFSKAMMLPFEKWSWKRVLDLFINLSRFLFWLVVTDFSLYFFYAHALQYHIQEVERLGLWTLNGLGYFLGQFFCNKYIVLYGLAGTIAKAERYYAPPTPKCIARIHLYSETWRTFDVGYYSFLLKYMYIPLCGEKRNMTRKLSASFLCFCFVFIWHGMEISVFIWSLLNFIGITLEAVGRSVANSELYKSLQKKNIKSNKHS
uniref:Protein-cysteine N-palmitoyltransferase Rasp n=1 Tax=Clastoptera arizonana TaxID=38151 RepID=A0A1B6EDN9_9HEMI